MKSLLETTALHFAFSPAAYAQRNAVPHCSAGSGVGYSIVDRVTAAPMFSQFR
jgi:hypothetical protein